MLPFRPILLHTSWKDFISKINPKISAYLIKDEKNFLLAWDSEDFLVQTKFIPENYFEFVNSKSKEYSLGFMAFDAKNQFEKHLKSENSDFLEFPELFWFVPKNILISLDGNITFSGLLTDDDIRKIIESEKSINLNKFSKFNLKAQTSKEEYYNRFKLIQDKLRRGDIYEINYCTSYQSDNTVINPIQTFLELNKNTEAPFSSFIKYNEFHVICGSPERFLKLQGDKILSQPIKGTAKREKDLNKDKLITDQLLSDKKELAENIMIVDLVRNDLSKIADKNSVKVDELNGLYSFKSVHQLISTVSCKLKYGITYEQILKALFPMGSMTGAPKISALEIIEDLEQFKRSVYSGTIGIIEPNGNFDFNVVIRSILYNDKFEKLSISVGGAITTLSKCEDEYEECLIKLEATQKSLC